MENKKKLPQLEESQYPRVEWDTGTAYELFLSLHVLHHPRRFGLRPAWAAGVRSRLPAEERMTLEISQEIMRIPFHWLYSLPQPKDASTAIRQLGAIQAGERLPRLTFGPEFPSQAADLLRGVAKEGSWGEDHLTHLKAFLQNAGYEPVKEKSLRLMLDAWRRPASFGEDFLRALEAYVQVFFEEEQRRISPYLLQGVRQAQELSRSLPLETLLESLSQGVLISNLSEKENLVLVSSFWSTPLIFISQISAECWLVTFGVRPPHASLVPGEMVPDALIQALKAIADPTRLRILRYLTRHELTPAELSRRLRLRAPTVIHHLNILRLAGLVHITLSDSKERRYAIRQEALEEILPGMLADFLAGNTNQD